MPDKILSPDLKVACEIWHYQSIGERVWFTKLVESLSWCMDKDTISNSLDTLTDWCVVYGGYGETHDGRSGWLLFIDTQNNHIIKELYETCWKHERHDEPNYVW